MTIDNIMKCKLRMQCVASIWIPHYLTIAQICEDMDQVYAMLGDVHRTEWSLL